MKKTALIGTALLAAVIFTGCSTATQAHKPGPQGLVVKEQRRFFEVGAFHDRTDGSSSAVGINVGPTKKTVTTYGVVDGSQSAPPPAPQSVTWNKVRVPQGTALPSNFINLGTNQVTWVDVAVPPGTPLPPDAQQLGTIEVKPKQ